jgi:hypothetical protein
MLAKDGHLIFDEVLKVGVAKFASASARAVVYIELRFIVDFSS